MSRERKDAEKSIYLSNLQRLTKGLSHEVTSCWKSVHRISGYQGYQPDITRLLNRYQEKIDQISVKYLTDQNIKNLLFTVYLDFSRIPVHCAQRLINLKIAEKNKNKKTAMSRSNSTAIYQGYQPDITPFCTPDVMSCHPLV